jgi:hypothetical protein
VEKLEFYYTVGGDANDVDTLEIKIGSSRN